jgi:pilus assembly protein CpaE
MRTLVVSNNGLDPVSTRLRGVLRTRVDMEGPTVARYEDVEKCLTQGEADMFVVALSPDPERGLEALRRLRRSTAGYVLAVGQTSEPKLILRALDHGADHYLDEADLEAGLEAVLMRLQSKREVTPPSGRLVAVLGASGGSGASTLSANLSAALAKEHSKCALIDLKPGRGDLAALFDLKPNFHLADLCLNATRLDQAMFEKALVPHPCGVHLLAAPQLFADTRLVTAQGVSQVLNLSRRLYSHVVADLEDCFHEEQLTALRQASTVVVVSRLDFTSLRNVRRILEHLEENGISRSVVKIAVNRYGQPGELPASEAEEALGGKLSFYIPDDPKTINSSNNTGVPAVLRAPSAKVSTAINQMARTVLERRRAEPTMAAATPRSAWF